VAVSVLKHRLLLWQPPAFPCNRCAKKSSYRRNEEYLHFLLLLYRMCPFP